MKEVIKASEIKQVDLTRLRMKAAEELNVGYAMCLEVTDLNISVGQDLVKAYFAKLDVFMRLGLIPLEIQEKLKRILLRDVEKEIERNYNRIGE